ncbi:hypothetical protein G6O69_31005 [Pseudenhygromyxa sp. WMMC2535]|nr:hypothetical protein [Pseudenhygromyxa sp. WMMC2535]
MVAVAADGSPEVDFPGNPGGPCAARSTHAFDAASLACAVAERREVLLVFAEGRPDAPIIIGLLQPPTPLELQPAPDSDLVGGPTEARIDGRRVELEGADEVILRCGKASITLRRNGRVVIRGAYVETRSSGVNRVKGGSVEIN